MWGCPPAQPRGSPSARSRLFSADGRYWTLVLLRLVGMDRNLHTHTHTPIRAHTGAFVTLGTLASRGLWQRWHLHPSREVQRRKPPWPGIAGDPPCLCSHPHRRPGSPLGLAPGPGQQEGAGIPLLGEGVAEGDTLPSLSTWRGVRPPPPGQRPRASCVTLRAPLRGQRSPGAPAEPLHGPSRTP